MKKRFLVIFGILIMNGLVFMNAIYATASYSNQVYIMKINI